MVVGEIEETGEKFCTQSCYGEFHGFSVVPEAETRAAGAYSGG